MTKRHLVFMTFLILVAGLCVGCGGSEPSAPSTDQLVSEGWAAWTVGDYATAEARFAAVLGQDPAHAGAATGMGWTHVRRNALDLARATFDVALAAAAPPVDAASGRFLVQAAASQSQEVVTRGLEFLQNHPTYVFVHDPSFATPDIRWLVARAALAVGAHETLVAQLDILRPGHGLNPEAATFPEEAATLLEALRSTV